MTSSLYRTQYPYVESTFLAYCDVVDKNPHFIVIIESVDFLTQALPYAITHNRTNSINLILDKLNIPNDLTLKERISYYYLLGKNK